MNDKTIQGLKNSWRNSNSSTIGFAKSVPTNKWKSKALENRFRSFAWEFACLARTRMCYLKALRTGELIFSHQEDIPDKSVLENEGKSEIVNILEKTAREVLKEIECLENEEKMGLIIWLLQHERVHHGKLMLYNSLANFKLPKTFVKTWGESNFSKT